MTRRLPRRAYVVRIEGKRTFGYQARIYLLNPKDPDAALRYRSKFFADLKSGGKRKARAKAEGWILERRKAA